MGNCTSPKPIDTDAQKNFISAFDNNSESNSQKSMTQDQLTAHTAKAMVLSCMDFRLLDDIVMFMNDKGYNNNYDQFILAGASLGSLQTKYKIWGESWTEHLGLAIKLHHVTEVICIDHDKCGAYKLFYPEMKPEEERQYHIDNLKKFRISLKKTHPNLHVYLYFMKLDGSCDEILED
mmetsp:Transcript_28984/g.39812  ORF Transcript_28984/g.39812 Transcript_28984/m.39812 type:complete len:178 (-) Transcript_28984:290-823(-)